MALVLPSTVEELNLLQNSMDIPSPSMYTKVPNKGFENIFVEKRYKREVSLPNGIENWNISNFDSYLNFEDNLLADEFKVIGSVEDRLVPEEGDQRQRCESFSSVSSSMDEKRVVLQNYGMKTFSTVCMDSGSTCISSDHSYVGTVFKGLEAEETYQNLDLFLQQVPEMTVNDNLSSPLSSNDSNYELSTLHSSFSFSLHGNCSQDGLKEKSSTKRPAEASSEDENYLKAAKLCDSPQEEGHYHDIRRKNNIASKNCRKTRKEKQKEMEIRVTDLEKEKEELKVEVQLLEELIQAHKMQLYAILQKR